MICLILIVSLMNNTRSLRFLSNTSTLSSCLIWLLFHLLLLFLLELSGSSQLLLLLQPLLLLQFTNNLQLSFGLNPISFFLGLPFLLLKLLQLLQFYFVIRLPQKVKSHEGYNSDDHVALEAIPECPEVGPLINLWNIFGINLRRSMHNVVVDVLREEVASQERYDH